MIHGGAWVKGSKDTFADFCQTFSDFGYITATIDYTLLNQTNLDSNIFRIIDEITAAIQDIKNYLISKYGFHEKKLEMALLGHSAGAHISLLYSYMIKETSIPLKFVINLCGPVTLEPDKYLEIINQTDPLESIDSNSIQKAIGEDKLVQINNSFINGKFLVEVMNCFLGINFNNDIDKMVSNNFVIHESQEYINLLNKVKYGFPTEYVDSNTLPTLCYYAGLDQAVGVQQYSELKKKFDEKGNNKISLIYVKHSDHNFQIDTEYVIGLIFQEIIRYSDLYFTKN